MAQPTITDSSRWRRIHWGSSARRSVGLAVLAATGVSVSLGVYGSLHDPTGRSIPSLGFSSTISMKNWLATAALVLLVSQALMTLGARGLLSRRHHTSSNLKELSRLTGTTAFALSLPVVFHCLWSLGYQTSTLRVGVHSLAGCAVYGAYAARFLISGRSDNPKWLVPVSGALFAMMFVATWWTGALWYFTTVSWDF